MNEAPANLTDTLAAPGTSEAVQDKREQTIIVVTSLGHFLCHLAEMMFPCVILAVIAEYVLTPEAATGLAVPGYVLLGLGALPVGAWADAWSTTKIFGIYFVLMAVSGVAVVVAPTPELLLIALTALGLAASIYHPTGLSMISLGISRRSRAMGINGVAGNFGIALAPVVGWWAIRVMGDWRWAYALIAGLATAFGFVMLVVARRGCLVDSASSSTDSAVLANTENGASANARPAFSLGRYWPLLLLLVTMMLGGLNYRCLVTALPTYLTGQTVPGGHLMRGGLLLTSLALLSGAVGQLLGGYLGERAGARRVYLGMIGSLVVFAAGLSTLEGHPAAVLVASLLAVGLFAQQPLENALLAESTSAARRSISYGWKFVLTFGVGAVGAQIVGIIWTETGRLAPVFWLISASAGVMLLLLALQRRQAAHPAR